MLSLWEIAFRAPTGSRVRFAFLNCIKYRNLSVVWEFGSGML